jgi:hypothetical protein
LAIPCLGGNGEDWERFIDWMALNGVNLPLAITGQEKVWLNVWKKFGLTDEEIRGFLQGQLIYLGTEWQI